MNDPTCYYRDEPRHVCRDKFGERWDRGHVGPRAGTRCDDGLYYDMNVARVESDALATEEAHADAFREHLADERAQAMAELGDLMASVMTDPDDEDRCEVGLDDYR